MLHIDNLMQGLEKARAVHVRWAEIILNRPMSGVRSVEDWRQRFCARTSPAVSGEIALAGPAYAGHQDASRGARAMSSTGTYVRAGLPEVATALAVLTGEPHPLAPEGPRTEVSHPNAIPGS